MPASRRPGTHSNQFGRAAGSGMHRELRGSIRTGEVANLADPSRPRRPFDWRHGPAGCLRLLGLRHISTSRRSVGRPPWPTPAARRRHFRLAWCRRKMGDRLAFRANSSACVSFSGMGAWTATIFGTGPRGARLVQRSRTRHAHRHRTLRIETRTGDRTAAADSADADVWLALDVRDHGIDRNRRGDRFTRFIANRAKSI